MLIALQSYFFSSATACAATRKAAESGKEPRPPAVACSDAEEGHDDVPQLAKQPAAAVASPQTLTKVALTQYKGTALESGGGTGSELEDGQLISLLSSQLQRGPRAESGQMIINIARLLARSRHNERALLSALPHMMICMQRHLEHAGLQESGLGLLGNLAGGGPESPLVLLRSGCLHHVIQCLQQHADHAGIQRNAYRCLRNVTSAAVGSASTECATFLLESRVPQLVCFLLHRHVEDVRVQQQALACVWSFACYSEPLARLLSLIAAADGVLRVLGRHPSCAEVQRVGCGVLLQLQLLQLLDTCDDEAEDEADRAMLPTARPFPPPADIAPAALAAAVAHPTSAAVQAVAIELVSALGRSRRSPRLRTEQLIEGLRCARAALEVHAHEATVVVVVCELYEESLQAHADEDAGMFTAGMFTVERSGLGGQRDDSWMHGPGAAVAHAPDAIIRDVHGAPTWLPINNKTLDAAGPTNVATPLTDSTRLAAHLAMSHEEALEMALVEPDARAAPPLGSAATQRSRAVLEETRLMLPLLFRALQHEHGDEGTWVEVAEAACSLLGRLCETRRLGLLVETRAVRAAIGLAHRWAHEVRVVMGSMRVLRCLASIAPAMIDAIFDANGLGVTIRGMRLHSSRLDVQEAGCSLLWSFALQPAPHERLLPSSEELQEVLLTLLADPTCVANVPLQRQLGGLLCTLSLRPQHGRHLGTPQWLATLARAAASSHASLDPLVHEYACATLANLLCRGGVEVRMAGPAATPLLSPATRFDVIAAAALAMRIGLATDATATLNAGARLVRQAASAWEVSLVSLLLRAEVPSLLWRALRDSEAAARMPGAAEQTSTEAAAALEALLRPFKRRLQLARAADAFEGGALGRHIGQPPLPRLPVAFCSLLSAHALARSRLPGAGSSGSECWLLPLPLACGVAAGTSADAVADWRFLATGRAAGARPAHHALSALAALVALSRGSGRFEVLAEEVQLLILAHAAADLPTLLAAYTTCARWRRLLRASDITRRLDLTEYADELRRGALCLKTLCGLSVGGPHALALCEMPPTVLEVALPLWCTKLRTLDLSRCAVPSLAVRRIVEGCRHLRVLDLSGAEQLDDAALAALGCHAAQLQTLSLNGCLGISDGGLDAIAAGVPSLRALHLYGCPGISERGVRSIAEGCIELEVIDLTASGGATDLALRSLVTNRCMTLRALGAGGAQLSDATMVAIATTCHALEVLFLQNVTGLTPVGPGPHSSMADPLFWLGATRPSRCSRPRV